MLEELSFEAPEMKTRTGGDQRRLCERAVAAVHRRRRSQQVHSVAVARPCSGFMFDTPGRSRHRATGPRAGRVLCRKPSRLRWIGTLGAGKTRLVQAIAAGCGIEPAHVTSPTFVLCQPYHGTRDALPPGRVPHSRSGRVPGVGCRASTSRDRASRSSNGRNAWPTACPTIDLEIQIEITGPHARTFELVAHGPRRGRHVGSPGSRTD